ncbi:MAG: 3'-5' exonuclease, partial [Planctomycetota bacterium]
LEDGLLPHEKSYSDEDEMEEERRLFFVGITRAKAGLYISCAQYRTVRGQMLRTIPSQFLYELGIDFAESNQENEHLDDDSDDNCQAVPHFVTGQLVRHNSFGLGTVEEFVDMGENSVVVVKFNSGQTKSLMVKYAGLSTIQNP